MLKNSCIVVDDDPLVVEQLVDYISQIPYLTIVNTYINPVDAVNDIKALNAPLDFLFTDVVMPQLSGLELAKTVRDNVKNIVLVTGHLEYAVSGYDFNAQHFLHKPFSYGRFEGLITKLTAKENSCIDVKVEKMTLNLILQDIIAFEAALNYVKVHTTRKLYVCYFPLKQVGEMLPSKHNFTQINRSFIVNLNHVKKIVGDTVYLENSMEVKCGRTYKSRFRKLLEYLKEN